MTKKTFKFQLINLNKENKSTIDKHLKVCCWLHNHLLKYLRKTQLTKYQLIKLITEIKKGHQFLKEIQSQVLQEVAKQVHKIWKRNKELKLLHSKKKHPNFKPTHRYNSLTYPLPMKRSDCGYKLDNSLLTKKRENKELKLTLGRKDKKNAYLTVKIRMERKIEGDIKTLTIKRKNGKHYVLFSCENVPLKIVAQN